MTWEPSPRQLPGPHRAQRWSRFGGLETARPAHVLSAGPGRGASVAAPVAVELAGGWTRGVTPTLARTRDTEYAPPAHATAWTPVEVPDNYGIDADLRRYFGPVWYRRAITRPPGGFVDLAFAAVDYLADIVLDGEHLGRHEGSFAPFVLDLTDRLVPGRAADLLVRVQDPLEALKDRRLFTRHRKRWIKGVMNYHDSRAGGMPGAMTPGWTFELGQSPPTGGIVGPVTLESSGPLRLDAVFVTPLDVEGRVHVCVLGLNRTRGTLRASLTFELASPDGTRTASEVTIDAPPGPVRVDLESSIEDPVLWWDAALPERGGPALYALETAAIVDGRASGMRRVTFGLRVADFPAAPRWHYVLNGVPVFVRAVNYIPLQHWARADETFYARDFDLMRRAHVHSAGIHAHVQAPACYRAADRAGISLVQDFPLQWSYASGTREDSTFVPRATAMAAEMACLLWNHPSVVAYTAHNEPIHALRSLVGATFEAKGRGRGPAVRAGLHLARAVVERVLLPMRAPDDEATDTGNRCLDRRLCETLAAVDPLRFVHDASGAGHDTHVYAGTIGGGTVYDVGAVRAPFVSEYGSFPITRRAHGRHDGWATPWPPGPPQVRDLCRQGFIATEALGAAGDITRYTDLLSLAEVLERKAAFVAKYQTEFFRIHRGDPYTGCRWHFFVNHWGYMGGGLLDVDRAPTLAYQALAGALRPRLAAVGLDRTVFDRTPDGIAAFAMNDRVAAWDARVAWRLEALASCEVLRGGRSRYAPRALPLPAGTYVLEGSGPGPVVDEGTFVASIPWNQTARIGTILPPGAPPLAPGPYRVALEWDDDRHRGTNTATILVTRRGWQAPTGLSVATPADVG